MPASHSPSPNISHEIRDIQVNLSFCVLKAIKKDSSKGAKKSAAPKGKVETKTKELSFTFESSDENYLSFLSELLKVHSHNKFTPVKKHTRFGIKVLLERKAKKDGIDIDNFVEYEKLVKKILDDEPSKLIVYLNLDDVKARAKCRDEEGTSNEDETDDEVDSDNERRNGVERELGRICGRIELKYANATDSGLTYITNDGEKVPLTPTMILEWARAIYDITATLNHPPNTLSFDPKTRARSLFQTPKATAGDDGVLQTISTILSDARAIIGLNSTTPSNITNPPSNIVTVTSSSPAKNSPTKLPRFLQYAEEQEGIQNATMFEVALSEKGFGPDIIMTDDIDKTNLISCGFNAGDAIHLKRAARTWWTSPDAKRTHQRSPTPHCQNGINDRERKNYRAKEFVWWFFNPVSKVLEKVPDGFVPDIDPEYLNPNDLFEPSPSPDPTLAD